MKSVLVTTKHSASLEFRGHSQIIVQMEVSYSGILSNIRLRRVGENGVDHAR